MNPHWAGGQGADGARGKQPFVDFLSCFEEMAREHVNTDVPGT